MTATVISLASHRRNHAPGCNCAEGFTCYPHRLLDLLVRIEDVKSDVEDFRFCDLGTFTRLTDDVREVLMSITNDCLPYDDRETR